MSSYIVHNNIKGSDIGGHQQDIKRQRTGDVNDGKSFTGEDDNPVSICQETKEDGTICGSTVLDEMLLTVYGEHICAACKSERSHEYQQMTQTDVISTYLLAESSMRTMKFMAKDNPKKSGWTQMKLYLRKHAEALAIKKWGSMEALTEEKQRREQARFEKSLNRTKDAFTTPIGSSAVSENKNVSKRSGFLIGALSAIKGDNSKRKKK
eukprot:gene1481-2846_t